MPQPDKFTFRRHASIGAAAAEEDAKFMAECFVDAGDIEPLVDCSDRRRIIVGQNWSGQKRPSGKAYQANKCNRHQS